MPTRRSLLLLLPLLLLVAVVMLFAANLDRPPQTQISSRMIGKPMPQLVLQPVGPHPGFSTANLSQNGPVLVNLFASWCLPCAVEAPQLEELKRQGVSIYGIAIRDEPADVATFLERHGNPFVMLGGDPEGRMMLALGASGVPETYVVDSRGIIRHQHLGDIRPEHVPDLLARLEDAR